MEEKEKKPRRLIVKNLVTLEECKVLEFIHKSCSSIGYRPNVFSTTLSHLIATNCAHFLIPFVLIRERLKDKVEEFFGCQFELFVEFTGLISWCRRSGIGWHSDDNRPYLKQRDFTAVCYLNSYAKDFKGGLFHFQDGEPTTVVPMARDVTIYTADNFNVHSVDEIIEGERLTLALWFSRDSTHDEDAKLISHLSEKALYISDNLHRLKLPMLASSNMYWFSQESGSDQESGFDICCARIYMLGFNIYSSRGKSSFSDLTELLMEPVQLARGNELFEQEFSNILHALQVVQFYDWKSSELVEFKNEVKTGKVTQVAQSQRENMDAMKSIVLKDHQLAEKVFGFTSCDTDWQSSFNWAKFSAAVAAWECYTCNLHEDLLTSLPYWRKEGIIYTVPLEGS